MPASDEGSDIRYERRHVVGWGDVEKFLLRRIPGAALALLFVALAVGLGLAGHFLVRRNVALATLECG
jgi:hypothetical protein